MVCKWQVEIDDYCQRVLKYRDVRDCGAHNLEAVDLICGGYPCQPHSLAGLRRGEEDDRNLWPEFSRVIKEIRPDWVIAENVPGVRLTILDQVLSDLGDLFYSTGTVIIPACAFNAPHRRERVFVIAHSDQQRLEGFSRDGDDQSKQRWYYQTEEGQASWSDLHRRAGEIKISNWWAAEPDVRRVAHGIPSRVDRLRVIGNAVVPQVAEWIGMNISLAAGG